MKTACRKSLWKHKTWCYDIKSSIFVSKAKPTMLQVRPMTLCTAGMP